MVTLPVSYRTEIQTESILKPHDFSTVGGGSWQVRFLQAPVVHCYIFREFTQEEYINSTMESEDESASVSSSVKWVSDRLLRRVVAGSYNTPELNHLAQDRGTAGIT